MVDFGVSIALSYFFYQLLAMCLATFAFRNQWILEKMEKRGMLSEKLTEALQASDDVVKHQGGAITEHTELAQGGWWTKVLGSGVCPLGMGV